MANSKNNYTTEELVERICQAARKLFVKKGYFNTSIPDIVRESGVSTGAIYHHFGNKPRLAHLLYQETMDNFVQRLEEKLKSKPNLKEKLITIIELLFEMTESDPVQVEYMIFVKHTEISEEALPICMSKPFKIVEELIKKGVKSGSINKGRPEILAASFMGITLKIIELKINGVIKYPLSDVLTETIQHSWSAISGK